MHNAPAVSYPVGRSRFQGAWVGLTVLGTAVTGFLWHFQSSSGGTRDWLYAVAWAGIMFGAVRAWRHTPNGILRWDGLVWSWSCASVSSCGVLAVHLDLQFWMVLSLQTDAGKRIWLWPERRADIAHWSALRRAIFSRGARVPPLNAGVESDMVKPSQAGDRF